MIVDENNFFRQATLLICGNLDFEIALQKCLIYLKSFMPADRMRLNIYDRGLTILKTVASATPVEAKKVNIILPLDENGQKFLDDPDLPLSMIINRPSEDPVSAPIVSKTGKFADHFHLKVK